MKKLYTKLALAATMIFASFASANAYTPQIGELMTCQIIYEVK